MGVTELLATFELGTHLCAVEVSQVQEVLLQQPLTPAPGAPTAVAGLINLRGQVVTALDLRVRMGLGGNAHGGDDSFMNVVVRSGDEVWSLLVDRIGDVIEVEQAQFELPPDTLNGPIRELIKGTYTLEDRLLLVLNVQRLLELSDPVQA
jgi:purine-binding chemotaxis protein CheW